MAVNDLFLCLLTAPSFILHSARCTLYLVLFFFHFFMCFLSLIMFNGSIFDEVKYLATPLKPVI